MRRFNKLARSLMVAVAIVGSLTLVSCGGDDDDDLVDANAGNVNNQQFTFADGAALGVAGRATTLAFTNNGTRATITAGTNTAAGTNTFGSCLINVQTSNFPATGNNAGPQAGSSINLPTCQVNTGNNTLSITNAAGVSATSNAGSATGSTGSGGN